MSVYTTATLSHNWLDFNSINLSGIAEALSPQPGNAKWRQLSGWPSPEEEFRRDGWVSFHLPEDFIIRIAHKIIIMDNGQRWSAFLIDEKIREQFVAACNRLAFVTGATEIMLLP